jgi:hypothetical protein
MTLLTIFYGASAPRLDGDGMYAERWGTFDTQTGETSGMGNYTNFMHADVIQT